MSQQVLVKICAGQNHRQHSDYCISVCCRVSVFVQCPQRSSPRVAQEAGVPPPGGVLVAGPASSGKTGMWQQVAATLQCSPQCFAYCEMCSCGEMAVEAGQPGPRALISAAVCGACEGFLSFMNGFGAL